MFLKKKKKKSGKIWKLDHRVWNFLIFQCRRENVQIFFWEKKNFNFHANWEEFERGLFDFYGNKVTISRKKSSFLSEVFTVPTFVKKLLWNCRDCPITKHFSWMKRFFRRFLISRFFSGKASHCHFRKRYEEMSSKNRQNDHFIL